MYGNKTPASKVYKQHSTARVPCGTLFRNAHRYGCLSSAT